jgi:hypothetical protein
MFQSPDYTKETMKINKAMIDYINAKIEFNRKVTPKYIKMNEKYLNKFMQKYEATLNMGLDEFSVDFKGVIPLSSIPVVIDNTIETFEAVYEN